VKARKNSPLDWCRGAGERVRRELSVNTLNHTRLSFYARKPRPSTPLPRCQGTGIASAFAQSDAARRGCR
jgi:hypothetical protein